MIDQSRKRALTIDGEGRTRAGTDGRPLADVPDVDQDPYLLARWHEMHVLIASLPAADRRLFDLLYYEGLSQPEAARRLRVPLRTLKRNWHDARARFRLALGNDVPF